MRLGTRLSEDVALLTRRQVEASKEVKTNFPEYMRKRVLEFVQFENTARMDDLGESVASRTKSKSANIVSSQSCL